MNYNLSPKAELLKDPIALKNHHELAENPVLRRHFDIAIMEMQRHAAQNTNPQNFNECAASHLRMLGAQDFVGIFLNLAETTVATPRQDTANLASNVPVRKN